ncbi:MAG: iron-containing alcohol dehydrogenase [Deltaproteobacteria bacterium]|nr:iron-containing alcohol dehydrogenase [Deltaproteobacteria bacterium]
MTDTVSWSFPTQVIFGAGAAGQTGRVLAEMGLHKTLIVTDGGVCNAGLLAPVTAALEQAGVGHEVFDGVKGNPLEEQVVAGHAAYRDGSADSLVALGGGSPMDVAKVVALMVNHREPLETYDDARGGDRHITEAVPPIVAIPTTAGTGSEVGRSGVVTLAATGRKTVFFSPKLLPRAAILDPELTRSMPPIITAATGFDALAHCLEAYASQGDHPMCDAIALGGIGLCARSLERAVERADDLDARGDMLKAAMMGAVAFQKGLGACHSLAHPLSTRAGLHHGLACALTLPAVAQFNLNAPGRQARYAEVTRLLTGTPDGAGCPAALTALRGRLGLAGGLKEAGVDLGQLEALADEAFDDVCHRSNPRPCSRDDLLELYRQST